MHLPSRADLTSRAYAATSPPGPLDDGALIALAALDPAAAATWLLERAPEDSAAVPRSRVTRLMTALAETIGRQPGVLQPPEILQLVERYGHLLAPESVTELAFAGRQGIVDPKLDAALRAALQRAPDNAGLLRPAAEV